MSRPISLIGAPSSAGAYAPGQEKAPATFRRYGLGPALTQAGRRVHDRGDVADFRWRPDPARPQSMNLDAVRGTAATVADLVTKAMSADEAVLVLGGDCTVELGTVAGALRGEGSIGIVYIDLDVDLNAPEASDGALDWTGVAHLLDLAGTEPELSGLTVTEVNPDHAPDEADAFRRLNAMLGPSPDGLARRFRRLDEGREQPLHGGIALDQRFRMPLHAQQEMPVPRLQAFDEAIGSERIRPQALGYPLDPLVMHAVHPYAGRLQQPAECGIGRNADLVHQ